MTDSLLLPVTLDRVVDTNGVPVSGARVFIYDAGTTNLKNVFSDRDLEEAAANPIVADSAGWVPSRYIGVGAWKVVIKDPDDSDDPGDWITLKTEDGLPGALNTEPFVIDGALPITPVIAVSTSSYEVAEEDYGSLIKADCSSGNITVTLDDPATIENGTRIGVMHVGSGNDVIVEDDGGTLVTLDGDGEVAWLVCDGTEWSIDGLLRTDAAPTISAYMLTVLDDASASAARATLGVTIGTHVQAYNDALASLAGLTGASNKLPYFSALDTFSLADFTAAARSLLDDADAPTMLSTLGLSTNGKSLVTAADYAAMRGLLDLEAGTDFYSKTAADAAFQPLDSDLTAVAGLSSGGLVARTGSGTAAARTLTAPAAGITVSNGDGVSGNPTLALANDLAALEGLASNGLIARTGDGSAAVRTLTAPAAGISVSNGDGVSGNPTLALANDLSALEGLGSTGIAVRSASDTWVQRSVAAGTGLGVTNGNGVSGNPTVAVTDAELLALAGLTSAADKVPYFTGSGTAAVADFTSFGRQLVDDANAAAGRTTLAAAAAAQTEFSISGMILGALANRDYRLVVNVPTGWTITSTTTRCVSGTATGTWKINTTALGGTANSISSTEQSQAHASSNAMVAGDDLVLTVSSVSSCVDLSFTVKLSQTLQ